MEDLGCRRLCTSVTAQFTGCQHTQTTNTHTCHPKHRSGCTPIEREEDDKIGLCYKCNSEMVEKYMLECLDLIQATGKTRKDRNTAEEYLGEYADLVKERMVAKSRDLAFTRDLVLVTQDCVRDFHIALP